MDFETALREQLEAKGRLTAGDKRIMEILDARPSRRRTRQLDRMARFAAAAVAVPGDPATIDWSSIDWSKALATILSVLIKLLPLLLLL